jgi:hypothetical protein
MPFQVKGTVIGFLGNEDKYPCHFKYKIGDEVIYDGEKYVGKLCSSLTLPFAQKLGGLRSGGPRYYEWPMYNPFWYAPISVHDESMKKYDGLGFRNVLETAEEPQYHMANLAAPNAFKWPPHAERTVAKAPTILCGDIRTCVVMKMEAFDISEHGHDLPYYRREMVILNRVLAKPEIKMEKILGEFSKQEIDGIYPALSQMIIPMLVEELQLIGYVDVKDGNVTVTKKGVTKLNRFKDSLTKEEKAALKV